MSETLTPIPVAQNDEELLAYMLQMSKATLSSSTVKSLIAAGITALAQVLFNVTLSDAIVTAGVTTLVNMLGCLVQCVFLYLAYRGRKSATGPLTGGEEAAAKKITAATAGTTAALALALLVPALVLLASPAHSGDGAAAGGGLLGMSLWAYLINLAYAMGGFIMLLVFWFGIVDRKVLKGFDTREEIAKGNMAVAVYAGLSLVALALVVGLSLG